MKSSNKSALDSYAASLGVHRVPKPNLPAAKQSVQVPTAKMSNTSVNSPRNFRSAKLTSEPIPKDIRDRVEKKIRDARIVLLMQQPFFGTLITRLEIYSADAWLTTMAVDGKYMYYNHEFVDSLELFELVFVFSHEVLHLAYNHLGRRMERHPRLHNIAADYVVNAELIEAKVGKFPPEGLYEPKYKDWSSEQVYDDLLKNAPKMSQEQFDKMMDKLADKMFDEHMNPDNADPDQPADGKPTKNGPAKYTEDEMKQIREEIKQQVITAAQQTNGIGNIPAGIERMVSELTAPKMDWRTLLQTQLNSLIPADYSFFRVNRKSWDMDPILPGMTTEEMLSIAVAIDTSGSISQEQATEFLSEVQGIMEQYTAYEITVFCFDTKCYNQVKFESDCGPNLRSYKVMGGGGTDGGCIFRHLKEQDLNPIKLVVFTDGYVGDWGDPLYCDTVWVIKGSKLVPPFGMHAYFDDMPGGDDF